MIFNFFKPKQTIKIESADIIEKNGTRYIADFITADDKIVLLGEIGRHDPREFNLIEKRSTEFKAFRKKFHFEVLNVLEHPQMSIAMRDYNGRYVFSGIQEKWENYQKEHNFYVPDYSW